MCCEQEKKQEAGDQGKAWESDWRTRERRPEKTSGLQAFLCDYTSVEKETRHSF